MSILRCACIEHVYIYIYIYIYKNTHTLSLSLSIYIYIYIYTLSLDMYIYVHTFTYTYIYRDYHFITGKVYLLNPAENTYRNAYDSSGQLNSCKHLWQTKELSLALTLNLRTLIWNLRPTSKHPHTQMYIYIYIYIYKERIISWSCQLILLIWGNSISNYYDIKI